MNGVIMKKIFVCIVAFSLGFTNVSAVNAKRMPKVNCPNVWKLTTDAGWIDNDVRMADVISFRESRCNPGAVNAKFKNGKITWTLNSNGTYDNGLLQINSSWFRTLRDYTGYEPTDLYNPEANALFASWILHNTSGRLGNWSIRTF